MFRTKSGQLLLLISLSFIYSVYNSYVLWHLVSTFGHTAISRKVVGKIVHATIPKGNMGYDQYTVPDDCSCRTYFCCFPLALANTFPWPFVPILSNFFEKKRTQNHPQCLSGLSRTFPDNLSRNSCILHAFPRPGNFECPTYVFGPFIPFFLLNWWPSSLENAIFFCGRAPVHNFAFVSLHKMKGKKWKISRKKLVSPMEIKTRFSYMQ